MAKIRTIEGIVTVASVDVLSDVNTLPSEDNDLVMRFGQVHAKCDNPHHRLMDVYLANGGEPDCIIMGQRDFARWRESR